MNRPTATRRAKSSTARTRAAPALAAAPDVDSVLGSLRRVASRRTLDGMARYGIPSDNALGVSMSDVQKIAKQIRKDAKAREGAEHAPASCHRLALALWRCTGRGQYEARMVAVYLAEPSLVTRAQMDSWRTTFDSWAVCDTACFCLFDRHPDRALLFRTIEAWSKRKEEFGKRAAFALLASNALHDKESADAPFLKSLTLIERAVTSPPDDRNFVIKGVSWALRGVGRRSNALHAASVTTAKRLIDSPHKGAQWVGRDAMRELQSAAVIKKLKAKAGRAS